MFDLPADYRLDVVFTPPPLRDTIDAAYYPAPQFKKGGVGQFYVTPTGDDPAALREHARAAVASLAAHEGFPGHDWYYQFTRARAGSISAIRWLTPGRRRGLGFDVGGRDVVRGLGALLRALVGEPRDGSPRRLLHARGALLPAPEPAPARRARRRRHGNPLRLHVVRRRRDVLRAERASS